MANMLVSRGSPTATTRFSEWAEKNAANLGRNYASEIGRRREAAAPPANEQATAAQGEARDAVDGDKHPDEHPTRVGREARALAQRREKVDQRGVNLRGLFLLCPMAGSIDMHALQVRHPPLHPQRLLGP
jgi:hypothetical protein